MKQPNTQNRHRLGSIRTVPSIMVVLGLLFLRSNLGGTGFLYTYAINGPAIFTRGEWYRLVSAIFLHWNLSHFIMNLISLWLLGTMVESLVGSWRVLVVYLMSGLLGAIFSATLGGAFVHSLGASGAILGLLGYLIAIRLTSPGALPQEISRFAIIMLIMNLISNINTTGLDVPGHLGGFIGGFFSLWVVGLPLHARLAGCVQTRLTNLLKGTLVFLLWFAVIAYPIVPHLDLSAQGIRSSIKTLAGQLSWQTTRDSIIGVPQTVITSLRSMFDSEQQNSRIRIPHPLNSYDLSSYSGNPSQIENMVRNLYSTQLRSESVDSRNPYGVTSYAQLWTAEVIDAFVQRIGTQGNWTDLQITTQRTIMQTRLETEFPVQVYLIDAAEYGHLEQQLADSHVAVFLETSDHQHVEPIRIASQQHTSGSSEYTYSEVSFPVNLEGVPLINPETDWIRLWIDTPTGRFYFHFAF